MGERGEAICAVERATGRIPATELTMIVRWCTRVMASKVMELRMTKSATMIIYGRRGSKGTGGAKSEERGSPYATSY